MPAPSWLLLAWTGLAATAAAAITGSLFGGRASYAWAMHARARSAGHALAFTALLGLLVYAVVYGLVFEATSRADFPFGLLAGFVHGAVAFALSRPRAFPAAAFRVWAMHVAYGGTAAFIYVTP